ncbi:hypothetical protein EVAR_20724_1 [Eumeta japonica]|uniref:Uncharacterized protein n=1 Tax=Eumeta variegata TaxID=151549 RepID=A0A4C1V936_EUMVA|nr:hypothetical protein EVAR_20724_1 [Eumeta japonica]
MLLAASDEVVKAFGLTQSCYHIVSGGFLVRASRHTPYARAHELPITGFLSAFPVAREELQTKTSRGNLTNANNRLVSFHTLRCATFPADGGRAKVTAQCVRLHKRVGSLTFRSRNWRPGHVLASLHRAVIGRAVKLSLLAEVSRCQRNERQ